MAKLTYIEQLNLYTSSLNATIYNYVSDYTYEHQCAIIKALLQLLDSATEDSEYESVSEEEKENINRLIANAKAILKPFNI